MGYRQGVRQRTLTPSFRWFESSYPNHVGMDFTPFKKPGLSRAFLIRSVIPPSPQKSRLFRGPQPLRGFAVVAAPIFSLKKSVACSSAPPLPQKSRLFWGPRPFGALQSSLLRFFFLLNHFPQTANPGEPQNSPGLFLIFSQYACFRISKISAVSSFL